MDWKGMNCEKKIFYEQRLFHYLCILQLRASCIAGIACNWSVMAVPGAFAQGVFIAIFSLGFQ
jgi:hypothetical protein